MYHDTTTGRGIPDKLDLSGEQVISYHDSTGGLSKRKDAYSNLQEMSRQPAIIPSSSQRMPLIGESEEYLSSEKHSENVARLLLKSNIREQDGGLVREDSYSRYSKHNNSISDRPGEYSALSELKRPTSHNS